MLCSCERNNRENEIADTKSTGENKVAETWTQYDIVLGRVNSFTVRLCASFLEIGFETLVQKLSCCVQHMHARMCTQCMCSLIKFESTN